MMTEAYLFSGSAQNSIKHNVFSNNNCPLKRNPRKCANTQNNSLVFYESSVVVGTHLMTWPGGRSPIFPLVGTTAQFAC